MLTRCAFVTLLTSDAYLPGALAIAAALKDVHRPLSSGQTVGYEVVCLVTPETVDVSTIRLLRKAFDIVIGVEVIAPPDSESLALLGRPDLDTALTKLHVFRLTQFSKVIFLDADVLPLRPLSHLFNLDHEFSAVPDVGWPDIFNSGVMVLSPGEDKFEELRELLNTKGTWDGADQGLLNEWRGGNWNRLSFAYNTTPTATYTYAPAYQRFGSQISVVHFIGPHKPWHSIADRAPVSSPQSTDMAVESPAETPATQQRAYDYGSLVDRWYNVYDRHYRSQIASSEPTFQPSKYTSAWNEESVSHAAAANRALGLEDLRRAALEGMGALGIPMPRAHGEGEYQTMPLEGRFDLIHPRTRAEREQTPMPNESPETHESTSAPTGSRTTTPEPSTPLRHTQSLTSGSPVRWATLPTPGINEIPPAPYARLISLPPTPLRYVPAPYKPSRDTREVGAQTISIQLRRQELERGDLSPMPLVRNSAAMTPPHVVTPVPTDTYFPKMWDIDQVLSSLSSSSSDTSLTTMELSPSKPGLNPSIFSGPSVAPASPEVLPHQAQRLNITGEDGSPASDPMQMKHIFPWEQRPRHAPGRVFPTEGSLFTALPRVPLAATPEKKTFRSPMPSPLVDFPPPLRSLYPSESPVPKRHAAKVPWSIPSASPLSLEEDPGRAETSSQDGDVEDEVDSEDGATRSRTRSSSLGMRTHTLKFRSIGVQTQPRELHEEGVQVVTFVPATEVAEKLMLMKRRARRSWSTPVGTSRVPIAPSISSPSSTSMLDSQSLLHQTSIAQASDAVGDVNLYTATSPPAIALSSSAGAPPLSQTRKGSRVWDPARGIEAFKRGSEEVLAKFMQIGSLEERA